MGVDPSLRSTGACAVAAGGELLEARRVVPPDGWRGIDAAAWIAGELRDMAARHDPGAIVIEGYAFQGPRLAALVEVGALVRDRLRGWRCIDIAPAALKKFVLGTGRGDKGQVRLAVYKAWGMEHEVEDVVEAYAMAAIGLRLLGFGLPARTAAIDKAQREVIHRLSS